MNWKVKINYRLKNAPNRKLRAELEGDTMEEVTDDLERKIDIPKDNPDDITYFMIEARRMS